MPPIKRRRSGRPRKHPDSIELRGDCQALRIISRFGGIKNLVKWMRKAGRKRTIQSVYLWIYSGGLIPPSGIRDVFCAESKAGIVLTDADWSPYVLVDEETLPQPTPTPPEASETPPPPAQAVVRSPLGKWRL